MKKNKMKRSKSLTATTLGMCWTLLFVNAGFFTAREISKTEAKKTNEAASLISSTACIGNINTNNVNYYLKGFEGCNFDSFKGSENTKMADCDYLIEELKKRGIQYLLYDGQYYTENGENLLSITTERIGDALPTTLSDGSIIYTSPYGGIVRGDKVYYYQENMLIIESEDMRLPHGYNFVSVNDIIATRPYSDLSNKNVYTEGEEHKIVLK